MFFNNLVQVPIFPHVKTFDHSCSFLITKSSQEVQKFDEAPHPSASSKPYFTCVSIGGTSTCFAKTPRLCCLGALAFCAFAAIECTLWPRKGVAKLACVGRAEVWVLLFAAKAAPVFDTLRANVEAIMTLDLVSQRQQAFLSWCWSSW
jgi:hypothetical protein